ncbi:MAG: LysE family translocator [Paraglaciecola sp.]|nr:LysE family translocator [Paraglaciecola sp.]NCT48840.1 LysE family translocator [Paraglaciecola sp.]
MPDVAVLLVFIPTFFLVSLTPGLCMTLAMTLGMTVGVRRTLWMMWGEMLGVALVAICAVLGVAALMLNYPSIFWLFKALGALYLTYIGVKMWRSTPNALTNSTLPINQRRRALLMQGFVTAVANPKGWAFMISLLPPFISTENNLVMQLAVLVGIIMCSEFVCMLAYATGGKGLRKLINRGNNLRLMNQLTGALLIAVGMWLVLS